MRLATFNILHGRSLSDGLVDVGRFRDAVRILDADVLGLQEVDRFQPRSNCLDLTAVAAQAMGAPAWRFEPALVGVPGGDWRAATEDDALAAGSSSAAAALAIATEERLASYGIGLVSRLPVHEWHVVRLRAAPVRSPVLVPGTRRPVLLDDEPRVGLAAVLAAPGIGLMTVATTHLSFVPGWNGAQLRKLTAALEGLPTPQVLLGDLNLPGALPRWLSGWGPLAATKTYPALAPSVQLDHVLGRGQLPAVRAVEARQLALSDHRALVVDIA